MKKILISIGIICLITGCTNDTTKKSLEENNQISLKETENSNIPDITVINYVINLENDVTNLPKETSSSTKEKLKNTFITLTDFIFYNGTINGVTFDELSISSKEKVLEIYTNIDEKIESYYPNYKEAIKVTSKKVYTNAIENANNLKETYKQRVGEDSYNNTKEIIEDDINRLKENISPTVDYVQVKSQNIYDTIKEKANNWYQDYKESSE